MLIKGCNVFIDGRFVPSDVEVRGGIVSRVEPAVVPNSGVPVFNYSGIVVPGLVDVHVHLREPGFFFKETMETGTAAAARGGYTAVCAMPNLNPVPDSAEHLAVELEAIRRGAKVRVYPYGSLTVGERGLEMADISAMADAAVAYSDDGRGVQDEDMMRECMRAVAATGKLLAAHCEVDSLLKGGYIHDGAYARAHGHRGICSESEWREVERDIRLAEETGCAFHVCHVSTKESVRLVREARARGVNVTAETAPHYLLLTEEELQEDGRFKMNPPLRARADRDALIEGLLDGTIGMIATDHAPHTPEEKSRGLEKSPMGVVGLECAFPVLFTGLVEKGVVTLEKLVELMSSAPAKRFGIPGGEIEVGKPANLAVFDIDTEHTIDSSEFASMGRATPFEGWRVRGKCLMTVCAGRTVWRA
ncbi:MAG TPA: dihydroorotase [Candidatus Scatomorpha gallistercoris]|nr:dihydroorotase [Candidatus Scatomorpha gallistercoris]